MAPLLHRAAITNHSMKIYMVSLLHRATINDMILASALACGDHRVKAKFHYASWFQAGHRQVRSQIPLRYLV